MTNIICMNLSSSCNFPSNQSCTIPTNISTVPIETLLSSPDNIEVNGDKFELQVGLSRNLTLTVNNGTDIPRCLNAYMDIINRSNNLRLPLSYKFESFWVINEDKKVWEKNLLNYTAQKTLVLEGGPEWSENKLYSVVIKLKDEIGKNYFIKLEKIKIETAI